MLLKAISSRLRQSVRKLFRFFGLEVARHRALDDFGILRSNLLRPVTKVIDAGANSGQWGLEIRKAGWFGPLYSFEPVSSYFAKLVEISSDDSNWFTYNCALGAECVDSKIFVSGNEGGSSSLFEIDKLVVDLQADTRTIGVENCKIKRLSCLNLISLQDKVFLKADVQGFELEVLNGCSEIAHSITAMELEVSFVELYKNQALIEDIIKKARSMGLVPCQFRKGFTNTKNKQVLQVDILFSRGDVSFSR